MDKTNMQANNTARYSKEDLITASEKRRMDVMFAHFQPAEFVSNNNNTVHFEECSSTSTATTPGSSATHVRDTFNVQKMIDFLEIDEEKAAKALMFEIMKDPLFRNKYDITHHEYRERTLQQLQKICSQDILDMSLIKTTPMVFLKRMEMLSYLDLSLSVKAGVQFLLWGGTILNLGTKRHQDKYLKKIQRLELPGCFAMTELEHGSNVRGLQTTATYDKATQEFIINTPNNGALKWWLGNAAKHGKMASVFARLIIDGKDYGVHCFVVQIRDLETHAPMPGIEIGDCGVKVGLNGVDNGWIRFSNVRIPRENLLNRFADVQPDGTYTSEIKSEGARFGALLGELVGGRVGCVASSLNILKTGLTIAVRYGDSRRQFGPSKKPEIPILDYRSHQVRMMPALAFAYATLFTSRALSKRYAALHVAKQRNEEEIADVHTLSAGLKAVVTWNTQKYLQTLRELCGGHGFAAFNRFGRLREDHDVWQTFEGDNTVLLQQVAHSLIKQFQQQFEGNQFRGMLKYMRKQMGNVVANKNPIITRFSGKKHLRNPEFQMQAFEYRSARLLQAAAIELQLNKRRVKDAFAAWNETLPRLATLARAYIEQVLLENFITAVEECEDPELKHILKTVCDLFALHTIEQDIGSFRNIELFKSNKAKAINNIVTELCAEVRTHAVSLVNAFNIPDFILDAPIGTSDAANGNYANNVVGYVTDSRPSLIPEESDSKPQTPSPKY